ncbi:MAG: hypothetical protein ACSW8J_03615, partial [bacterium]
HREVQGGHRSVQGDQGLIPKKCAARSKWDARFFHIIAIFKNDAICWEMTPSVTYGDSSLSEGAFWPPRSNFDDCYSIIRW